MAPWKRNSTGLCNPEMPFTDGDAKSVTLKWDQGSYTTHFVSVTTQVVSSKPLVVVDCVVAQVVAS